MTYQDFLDKIKDLIHVAFYNDEENKYDKLRMYGHHRYFVFSDKSKTKFNDDSCVYETWVIGGLTGGSCWDNGESHHYPVSGDEEPENNSLEQIIDCICPNAPYKKYKEILNSQKTFEYTENEYYGNCTEYRATYIL